MVLPGGQYRQSTFAWLPARLLRAVIEKLAHLAYAWIPSRRADADTRVEFGAERRYLVTMTKATIESRSSRGGTNVIVTKVSKTGRRLGTVKFGDVTIKGALPSKSIVSANVALSTVALERVVKKLVKPGVVLRPKKDVPRFSAVEDEPGVFLRRLNGVEQRGRVVNGEFEVID